MKKFYTTPDLTFLRIDFLADALSNSKVNENRNIDIEDITEPPNMPTAPDIGEMDPIF